MRKKTLFIVLLGISVIVISSVWTLTSFRNKEAVSMPRRVGETPEEAPVLQTPEEMLKEIIKKSVKPEFLPSIYKITDKPEDIELPFRDTADHFFTEWNVGPTRFVACVGYNKTIPKELIGYEILIFIKDPDLTAIKLADKFLNSLPAENWKHEGPYSQGWYEIKTSSVISTSNHDKTYIGITSLNFFKSVMVPYFSNTIRKMGLIAYMVYMPNNPYYGEVEDLQKRPFEFPHR